MAMHWLFPTPVLQVDLEPDAETAAAMQQQLEQFDTQVYQHPEFRDRKNLTGDQLGHVGLDQLHRMNAFHWLNGQLSEQVSVYLNTLLGDNHGLVAHIQKAWPVVCARTGGTVAPHTHRNSQLSAVFYVLTDPKNESGGLKFEAPDDYFSHVMAIPYRDAGVSGGAFAPLRHRLLVFPSDLRHQVLPYEGSGPRYSVSYDLAITTAPGKGREMQTPHPMDWVSLGI